MANNKRLGKKFEERVAKKIAEIWGVPERCITRTVASGTYAHDYGDIQFRCGIELNPPLVVECKRDTSLHLETLFNRIPPKWITQLEDELRKAEEKTGKIHNGVIVWGKPRFPIWVITNFHFFEQGLGYVIEGKPHIKTKEGFYMFQIEDFFSEIKPKRIKEDIIQKG